MSRSVVERFRYSSFSHTHNEVGYPSKTCYLPYIRANPFVKLGVQLVRNRKQRTVLFFFFLIGGRRITTTAQFRFSLSSGRSVEIELPSFRRRCDKFDGWNVLSTLSLVSYFSVGQIRQVGKSTTR